MHGDFTRWTHRPENHYRSVLLQQGRVLLDADWNEQTQIGAHHDEVRTVDVVGRTGTPAPRHPAVGGFAVVGPDGAVPAGPVAWVDLHVTPGRYYVDGILCESEDNPEAPAGWPLTDQPCLPARDDGTAPTLPEPELPDGGMARHALYLDVWTHHVTPDEEPALLEPALGGPDTATRAQTVWLVRTRRLDAEVCADLTSVLAPGPARELVASLRPPEADEDPCEITAVGGYQLLENQLYRVQIHEPGTDDSAGTFLWSRENGSVVAALLKVEGAVAPAVGSVLSVDRAGRDEELSVRAGDVVEVTSTDQQLRGLPGYLATVTTPGPGGETLTVEWEGAEPSLADLGRHPVVRRWESLPLPVSSAPQELEGGVLVELPDNGGRARTGEYWLIPARTVRLAYGASTRAGTIEWPTQNGAPVACPPLGPVHHVAPLAILEGSVEGWSVESDCRTLFPPLTGLVAIDLLGGDGQEAMPGDALDEPVRVALRRGGLAVVDEPVRFTVVDGGLSADDDGNPADPGFARTEVDVPTDDGGVAAVRWRPGSGPQSVRTQTLRARRIDDHQQDVGVDVIVTGRLSVAAEVQWEPPEGCERFGDTRTVQDALVRLVQNHEHRLLGGDGQHATFPGQVLPRPVRVVVDSPCGPVAGAKLTVSAGGGLMSPVQEDEPVPETLEGRGSSEDAVESGSDGVVAVWWQPRFGRNRSAVLSLLLEGSAPVQVTAQLATGSGRTPGVHVTALRFSNGTPFENDGVVGVDDLASGITVELDEPVRQESVQRKPVVRVELDLPWPFADEGGWWADGVVGYRTVELAAEWNADGRLIVWGPEPMAGGWLQDRLFSVLQELSWERPVVGRFEIDGWGIVHQEDEQRHLNGHARTHVVNGRTRLVLPTDDEVTGGAFVQWFWLRHNREDDDVRRVVVPELVGRPADEARALLGRANLTVGTVTSVLAPGVPLGTVTASDPAAGTEVEERSAVNLSVATRRIPVPPPIDGPGPIRADVVVVPDVSRMTRARAERVLSEAGLTAEVEEETNPEIRRNSVVGTTPAAGEEVSSKTTVTLRVSSGRG